MPAGAAGTMWRLSGERVMGPRGIWQGGAARGSARKGVGQPHQILATAQTPQWVRAEEGQFIPPVVRRRTSNDSRPFLPVGDRSLSVLSCYGLHDRVTSVVPPPPPPPPLPLPPTPRAPTRSFHPK